MSEVQTAAKVQLTNAEKLAKIDTKIAELQAKREELVNLIAGEAAAATKAAALANVTKGDKVRFTFGRKENRAEYVGEVIFRDGDKVKVLAGEGADIKLLELAISQLDEIVVDLGQLVVEHVALAS